MKKWRLKDYNSAVGNRSQSNSSSDENSEECNLSESATTTASEEHWSDEGAIGNILNLDTRSISSSGRLDSSSNEETGSSEEKSFEDESYIREFGLVFLKSCMKENWDIKIVLVGHGDCGKSQLIKSVFGDHPSFTCTNHRNRDEYHIALNNRAHFQIWIYDVMDVEYIQEAEFPSRTAILFCYGAGDLHTLKDLEDTWIPLFFNNFDETMLHILVGIERDPATEEMATERVKNREEFKTAEEKLLLFFSQHKSRYVSCSFEYKGTILEVFQETIDAVYP